MAAVSEKSAEPAIGRAGGQARLLLVLALVPVLLLPGCGKTWVVTFDGGTGPLPDGAIVPAVLTSDGDDSYAYGSSGSVLRLTAPPTNASSNLRNVFWPATAPQAIDGQSCATWVAQTEVGNIQQGAALRVLTDADGDVLRAVTVSKNIFFGVTWVFNVAVWDLSSSSPRTGIGQVDLKEAVGGEPLPWHLCARTVGAVLTMKAWAGDGPEPEWGDASHGASVTLPPEWVYPGRAGWYVGHLPPGGFADFADLKTWNHGEPAGPPRPRPRRSLRPRRNRVARDGEKRAIGRTGRSGPVEASAPGPPVGGRPGRRRR